MSYFLRIGTTCSDCGELEHEQLLFHEEYAQYCFNCAEKYGTSYIIREELRKLYECYWNWHG